MLLQKESSEINSGIQPRPISPKSLEICGLLAEASTRLLKKWCDIERWCETMSFMDFPDDVSSCQIAVREVYEKKANYITMSWFVNDDVKNSLDNGLGAHPQCYESQILSALGHTAMSFYVFNGLEMQWYGFLEILSWVRRAIKISTRFSFSSTLPSDNHGLFDLPAHRLVVDEKRRLALVHLHIEIKAGWGARRKVGCPQF